MLPVPVQKVYGRPQANISVLDGTMASLKPGIIRAKLRASAIILGEEAVEIFIGERNHVDIPSTGVGWADEERHSRRLRRV
jgi:hypothetical protein